MKFKLLILFACLSFTVCNSQIGFSDTILFDNSNSIGGINKILSVDIDNDTNSDLLVATKSNIGWFQKLDPLTDDYSNYKIIASFSINSEQTSLYAKDIDGDGDLDVLFGSSFENIIYWSENLDGLGNFGNVQLISNELDGLSDIIVDDIDGDGDNDVISVSKSDGKIAWYENLNGLGDFGSQQIIAINNEPNSVLVIDIDMDGDLDILSNSFENNEVMWYKNLDGLGTFGAENLIEQLDYFVANSMDTSDLDGDGDYDIIVGYSTGTTINDRIVWYENLDGLGNFSSSQIITDNINVQYFLSVVSLDFDNDGDIDVVSASDNDGKIAWYENIDGLGNFASQAIISDTFEDVKTLNVIDLNEDGNFDIIGGIYVASQISDIKLRYNFSDMGYNEFTISSAYGGLDEIYPVDVNNDGNIDILSQYSSLYNDKFLWLKNVDGNFEDVSPKYASTGYNSSQILPADINNDGFIDVFIRSYLEDVTLWSQNILGFGFFGNSVFDLNDTSNIFSLSANDLNGDNYNDFIIGRSFENEIAWYENYNGITFSSENLLSNTPQANSSTNVHTSDIDGDGDYDILVSIGLLFNESKIIWYENLDGLGNFSDEKMIYFNNESSSVGSIYTSDIDEDGDMDVITYWRFQDKIVWYENTDGNGNYSAERIIAVNVDDIVDLSIGDLDNDEDLDVVSISRENGEVAWYNNQDGLGNFSSQQIITSNLETGHSVFTYDIGNDGNLDVVSSVGNKIVLHKNIGIATNELSGFLKVDVNSNGCDTSNVPANNLLIETTDGNNSISTFSLGNGFYQLFPIEGIYTTTIASELPTYYTTNPNSQISNFVGIGNTETIDFCIESIGVHNDLSISVYPSIDDPRPGFDTTYQINYNNIGTTQISGSISFEYDNSKLNFLNASETVSSQTINTLNFDFNDLNPFETRTIDLEFNVFAPPTTNIGDTLVSTATINPISGDETEEDNLYELLQTVIGSYDPNDMTVLEGDEIFIEDVDKYLHYLIRFQNTGTSSAINVRVEHMLDDKLDWTTMLLENLSHTARVEIENETDISFIFNNINLSDSTNDEPNSHGYIAFKIRPKSNVQVGDIISGIADIYFDFNPPITTNTANTEIVETLSIDDARIETIKLYPNPTKGFISIKSNKSIESVKLYNNMGQILYLSTNSYSIDLSNFPSGIYIIEIIDINQSTERKKIVKR